jgi:DNA-directed RNA polymerase subunit RPC12/RpoP
MKVVLIMAVKTHRSGSDKNFMATCQACNSDVVYKGSDVSGGENGVQPYIDCPECDNTIIHDNWNAGRYRDEFERNKK